MAPTLMAWVVVFVVSEYDGAYDWLFEEADWMGALLMEAPETDVAAAVLEADVAAAVLETDVAAAVPEADVAAAAPAVRDSVSAVMEMGPVAPRVSLREE